MHSPTGYLCLFLVVCGCSEPEFQKVRNPDVIVSAQTLPLQIGTVALDEPNRYRVEIKVKNSEVEALILEKGSEVLSASQTFTGLKPNSEDILGDEDVLPGATYSYRLKRSLGEAPLFEGTVQIPKDFVVGVDSLASKELQIVGYKRMFFPLGSELLSDGRALNIDVDEIIAAKGTIVSWQADSPALEGIVGSNSEPISVKARLISGELEIINRGQKGGKGSKGVKGRKSGTGGTGAATSFGNGAGIQIGTYCTYDGDPVYAWRYRGLPSFDDWTKYHPGRGLRGEVGLEGQPGYPGMRGGNGGEVRITVPETELTKIKINAAAGLGGNGGDGGEGGDGGDGGPGGPISGNHACDRGSSQCCREAPQGPQGEIGPIGPIGPNGPDGAVGKVLLNDVTQPKEVFP